MSTFRLLLQVLLAVSNCTWISAKVYRRGTNPYRFTILEKIPSFSRFTCMVLCGQTSGCHTIIWKKTFPPCILIGRGGSTLLSTLNGSLPFHTSQIDVTISTGIFGVELGSDLMNAFDIAPSSYYKSAYRAMQIGALGFTITFGSFVNVTAIQLIFVNVGQGTPNFMHWHLSSYPYCESSTPYPRPTRVLLQFDCPLAPAVNNICLDLRYQGYVAFNNLKIIGLNNEVVFP